jgi:alpha-glucosidase
VSVEAADPDSTLTMYRRALALRARLLSGEGLDWLESDGEVLHFQRSERWHCITNYGAEPAPLPQGDVVISSAPLDAGRLPQNATAWVELA